MLNPSSILKGQEQYEEFVSCVTKKTLVQYDYRHTDGELFSCVKPTLEACRKEKETWIATKKELYHEGTRTI